MAGLLRQTLPEGWVGCMAKRSDPIGVFDSGLGGLTAVRRLRRLLPGEDLVFLGDTGRVPYGERTVETIEQYARQDLQFLLNRGVKAVVIACGTISSVALHRLPDCGVPLFGVVEPAADKAAALSRSGRIGVAATSAAVRSGAYARAIRQRRPDCTVTARACPLFASLIEAGHLHPGDRMLETAAEEYLTPLREADIDTLILGCTHYPLISEVVRGIVGESVTLVDVAAEAVDGLAARLCADGMLSPRSEGGALSCWVTDDTERFAELAGLFLEEPGRLRVERTSL